MYDYMNPMRYQPPVQLVRVSGIEGAKAYQMPANSTVALFDANDDLLYIKSSDGAGFPTIRVFQFKERREEPKQLADNYITRNEFDAIRSELDEIKEAIRNGKQSVRKQQQSNE